MTVRVLTDSTAHLDPLVATSHDVVVAALHVMVEGKSYRDGLDWSSEDLIGALRARRRVSTSRPSPQDFAALFTDQLRTGADELVAVHLSRELSGTWEAANIAASEVGRVRVVDSRTTAMGLGFAVLAAASAARAGADGAQVERIATQTAARTATLFSVPTLEYLRRGGRIGAARAMVGTALSVKPLLHVHDGQIVAWDKVRTSARATTRLVDRAAEIVGQSRARVAVHHLGARAEAEMLARRVSQRMDCIAPVEISELGAVIGAHTGPGVLGIVVLPDETSRLK